MEDSSLKVGSSLSNSIQTMKAAPEADALSDRTSSVGQNALKTATSGKTPPSLPAYTKENAKRIANRLGAVTKLLNAKNANNAMNVIARWRGDNLDLRTLDPKAGLFAQIGFKIMKIFTHDKSWKERVINDLDYLDKNIPDSPVKNKLLNDALKAAQPILQTGSFFGTPNSIAADRRLRNLSNKLNPPSTSKPSINTENSILAARELAHGAEKPDQIDFSHAAGMTIATSVGGDLGRSGLTCWTTAQEVVGLKALIKEKPKLKTELSPYLKAAEESLPLNVRIQLAQKKSISKDTNFFSGLAADYKQAIDKLKPGEKEFVFMDCNFEGHCMRAVFSKDKKGFVHAQLFDTSGEIEAREGNFITANLRLLIGSKQKVCLDVEIHPDRFKQDGQAWLEQVIGMDSKDTREKMGHQHLSEQEMSAAYRRVFSSIRSTSDVVAMAPVQTMGNCYAKRLEAAQLEILGPKAYLELRLQQYSILEVDINRQMGIKLFNAREPRKMGRIEYLRVRNQLQKIPRDVSLDLFGKSRYKEAFWKMYQHDRAVMLEELSRL